MYIIIMLIISCYMILLCLLVVVVVVVVVVASLLLLLLHGRLKFDKFDELIVAIREDGRSPTAWFRSVGATCLTLLELV